jgi:glycosyltransferase involved in cell wall biosynthesis
VPRVSVIIPLYNCAPYVADAVRSVLAQPVPDLEVIVVDDGSTDGGADTLAQFGGRIRVLTQENSGAAAARNHGLREARGDLIAFLDADDWWLPNRLPAQLAALETFPDAGLVFSDFMIVDLDGHVTRARRGIVEKYNVPKDGAEVRFEGLFAHKARLTVAGGSMDAYAGPIAPLLFRGNLINTCSVLIRREALKRCGEFDPTLSTEEDFDLWLRVARDFPFVYVDEPLLAFRRRPGQLTRADQSEVILRNVARVTEMAQERLGALLPAGLVKSRRARLDRDIGSVCLRTGRKSEARRLLGRSLRLEPASAKTWMFLVLTFAPTGLLARVRAIAKNTRKTPAQ